MLYSTSIPLGCCHFLLLVTLFCRDTPIDIGQHPLSFTSSRGPFVVYPSKLMILTLSTLWLASFYIPNITPILAAVPLSQLRSFSSVFSDANDAPLCQTYLPLDSQVVLWTPTVFTVGSPQSYLLEDF